VELISAVGSALWAPRERQRRKLPIRLEEYGMADEVTHPKGLEGLGHSFEAGAAAGPGIKAIDVRDPMRASICMERNSISSVSSGQVTFHVIASCRLLTAAHMPAPGVPVAAEHKQAGQPPEKCKRYTNISHIWK
jgi:hypothetical protein